ncbi:MAG: hypothetical protein ACOYWZ_01280 [Bacillota bacterium]
MGKFGGKNEVLLYLVSLVLVPLVNYINIYFHLSTFLWYVLSPLFISIYLVFSFVSSRMNWLRWSISRFILGLILLFTNITLIFGLLVVSSGGDDLLGTRNNFLLATLLGYLVLFLLSCGIGFIVRKVIR